jgi:glycosyltransferase involved in cell wall biosynthesis
MRVLMTVDAVGGVWGYALELAAGLAARGVEVELAAMGPAPAKDQLLELSRSGAAGFRHGNFALEWEDDPWPQVERAGEWLLQTAAELAPDVVHLNGYVHGALPWDAPVLVAGHSCVLSWHAAVRGRLPGCEADAYREAVGRGIRAAAALVAPTSAMLGELERLYGRRHDNLVIPNGRDAAAFRPRAKEPFVAGSGRLWDEAKNLAALDCAAASLPWPVLLAGDCGGRSCRAARPLGRLATAELAALLGRASVFAAPARYEPFGMAALEAALSGCALVLGDIASLREVWGDAAAFVPPDDADVLAHELRRLIAHPRVLREAGIRARAHALRYDRSAMSRSYHGLYAELAGSAEAGASARVEVHA